MKNAELTVDSTVNEKHNQNTQYESVQNDSQLKIELNADNNGGNDCTVENKKADCELNFQNLKLQCMCSDVEACTTVRSNLDATSNQPITDDGTEIEISDVEAVTEMGETIFENHRCTHCGQSHCCFFLRCCYCTASGLSNEKNGTADTKKYPEAFGENYQCKNDGNDDGHSDTNRRPNSSNIANDSLSGSRANICSSQNLAIKHCEEICKIIHEKHGAGLCSSTAQLMKKQCCEEIVGDNYKYCTVIKSISMGCHCRWYCVQESEKGASTSSRITVDAGTSNTVIDDQQKCESSLAVKETEILSPTSNETPLNFENHLRCCRCSKELF